MTRALYLFVREGVAKDIEPKPRGGAYGKPATSPSPHEDEAAITIGEEGGDTVFPYFMYSTVTLETGVFTEISRETKTKRVENPQDSSQYVDVEQIEKLKMKNKNDPTDTRVLELKNPK